jgi:rhodanese-related sulfurtransferase
VCRDEAPRLGGRLCWNPDGAGRETVADTRSCLVIQEVDPVEVADRADVIVLDVREPEEWQAGRIEEAVHIPMNTLPSRLGELDSKRPVVAVCRSGHRSAQVTAFLVQRGFEAYNLRGGMEAWRDMGLSFTTPDGQPGRVV